MSINETEFDSDEYDKPGAERSRRRRGEDDEIESDLEEELLEDDGWASSKKNPSELSDEELNDDLLQSDDEDQNVSDPNLCINASYTFIAPCNQQDDLQQTDYPDDMVNLGPEGYEEGEEYRQGEGGEYTEEYSQGNNADMPEDQMDYSGEHAECDDGYQDEVLDLEINEPIDGEFQDDEYSTSYDEEPKKPLDEQRGQVKEAFEEEEFVEEEEDNTESSQVESEAVPEEKSREESDEEDEEDEESGRLRFKSERKEGAVVRLADAGRKRSNIPETLELSEKAKADLKEFEEQEERKRQNRYGRGRGGGRGGRGRGGLPGYGMHDFRGNRRRMNDQRYPLMGNMSMQHQALRMPPPHHQQQPLHSQQHHAPRPRGPPPFTEPGRPLVQQPLQPLIPPHLAHRSPPLRSQMEPPPPRMMSSPPPGFPQHHQHPPPQPKNIHINPHFRGPSSSVQVPLMPPAQSQPRPAVGPPRFPGQGEFQQHMSSNFGQPQRPPHHMEPFRSQPPPGPQDREPLFMGEHTDSPFPGQPLFDHHSPSPLMNTNLHPQQLSSQGHMGFGPPGPAFNQPGQGPLGLFQREPHRPCLPTHQGQGMVGLNQGGPPNQPRHFMGPRQAFGQPRNLFNPPVQFGMQVRLRPPHLQDSLAPHPPHSSHAQQHHHQQQQLPNEARPMMHPGQIPFHPQQAHGSSRHLTPRSQNAQLRNMTHRQRMSTPNSKQVQNPPQRSSNLRVVPVAPGNTNMNSTRPATSAANVKPVAKATQGVRPGQYPQPVSDSGKGHGQPVIRAKTTSQLGEPGRTGVQNESSNTGSQNLDEDEETRQYRLKIEEQKRLREEILKRKEMRRQMQAGVRKKELLDRLNSNPQSQGPPPQTQAAHPNQPLLQPAPQQPEPQQQQPRLQQQRQIPQRQQSVNQTLRNPSQGTPISPNGSFQTLRANPNVKTRPPMVTGSNQQQQPTGASPEQPLKQTQPNQPQPVQQQQRRGSALQNASRPTTQIRPTQVPQKNIPTTSPTVSGPVETQGPKPGAKRTVMQRTRNAGNEVVPVPPKVRVLKLPGAGEAEVTGVPVKEQGTWSTTPHTQGVQRKVSVAGQQQPGPNVTDQPNQGGLVDPQQNRVVVSGRGRGRGAGQVGRGRAMATRTSQKATESGPTTVSIEGLSSSTTEIQLKNLLRSIGPIEMFKMIPQQRKAIAKFSSPQHASSFQMSFHRHMIDLSHIDVSLIDG